MEKLGNVKSIDDYINKCPEDVRGVLNDLRDTIKKAAPEAAEKIGYQMPAFFQNGILVYFAAQKKHIGFYPGATGIEAFKKELAGYETSKGTIRFPYDKPLPLKLISEIVKFRLMQNLEKTASRKNKK